MRVDLRLDRVVSARDADARGAQARVARHAPAVVAEAREALGAVRVARARAVERPVVVARLVGDAVVARVAVHRQVVAALARAAARRRVAAAEHVLGPTGTRARELVLV